MRVAGETSSAYKPTPLRVATPAVPKIRPTLGQKVAGAIKPAPRPRLSPPKPPPRPKVVPPGQTPGNVTGVRSLTDLTKLATDQTDAEQAGQINPLQHESDLASQREQAAADELNKIFGDLQPTINQSMQLVSDNWDRTREAQQALFSQAGARLNQVKQDAASEAQNLAQQMGGPVAVDKFTGAIDSASLGSDANAIRSQTASMGAGNVGLQELADWSGKVYPLIRTEKQLGTRQGYEDQISKLQDQIGTIKGQRQGQIDTKLNDLLEKERGYQLNQAQLKLQQTKAARDWVATQHTLTNDDRRLQIASGQLGVSQYNAATNRSYKQEYNAIRKQKLSNDQINAMNKLNMSKDQFQQRMALERSKLAQTTKYQQGRLSIARQKNAMQLAKGLGNPASMKTLTLTHKIPITDATEQAMASVGKIHGAFQEKGKWYQLQTQHITTYEWMRRHGFSAGNSDPQSVYKMLTQMGYSPIVAANSVKAATGVDPRQKSSKRGGGK